VAARDEYSAVSRRAIVLVLAAVIVAGAAGARAVPPPARDYHDERSAADGADTAGPLDIASIAVAQDGDGLVRRRIGRHQLRHADRPQPAAPHLPTDGAPTDRARREAGLTAHGAGVSPQRNQSRRA